jgi:hypothetical protein
MTNESSMPPLAVICDCLGDVITARNAETLLNRVNELPPAGTIVVAPNWTNAPPKIDVGRKGKTRSGDTVAMPVRLDWAGGNVLVTERGANPSRVVRIIGLGHDTLIDVDVKRVTEALAGSPETLTRTGVSHMEDTEKLDVLNNEDTIAKSAPIGASTVAPTLVNFASKAHLERRLRALINRGEESRWRLINSLEPFALLKLKQANAYVAAELGEFREHASATVLDDIDIEDLLTKLLYGDAKASSSNTARTSVIIRMVERSTDPMTFRRVDPMHYIAVFIRARAEEAVRTRIGDPKIGTKIRRVAKKTGATSIEELIDNYRELYPNDSLAHRRAYMALTAGVALTANQKMLSDNLAAEQQ